MKVSRSAIIVPLFLLASLISTEKLLALPAPPPGACIYALDPSASAAFQIAGAQSTYTACGVVVESTSSSGFEMEGAGTLYLENHAQVSVVGGASLTGQTYLYDTISAKDVSAGQTTSPGDPFASLAVPTSGTIVGKSATYYDMNSKPANNTISPGIYCGGLEIGSTNGTTFTFSPGVYILAGGGLTLESEAQVAGTGVTFYNTSSSGWGCSSSSNYTPVTISGQVTATFSAPTSGTYNGILFFGNRTGCSTAGSCEDQINGGSTAILNGVLYFKSDEIMITGSNASGYMELVADKIYINGNSNFGNNGNPFDDITVSVGPSAATLAASQTQQFTAAVANTANTAVTWTISPSVGSISSSGLYTAPSSITAQQTITVTATSQTDTSKTGTATITLTPPVAPTITFTVANQTYGVAPFTVAATSSSSGAFTYSVVSGPATISGSTVTITGVGTVVLQASQAASGNYTAGTANASFTVSGEVPTITFSVSNKTYGVAPFTVAATSNSSGALTYSVVSGSATISGSTVTLTGVGTVVLQASQAASGNYAAGTQSATFTVSAEAPAIVFTVANQTYGVAPFMVAATSNSSGPFTYAVISGPATVSGSTVSITGVGTVVLQASQAASGNYATGTANATFTVAAETPSITFSVPNQTYGVSPFTVSASSNSTGAFTYSVVSGPATISGSTVTITGVGTVVLQASQAASGNYTASTQNATFTVAAEAPTVTFGVSNQTYGVAPFAVSASSNSSGAITYSVVSGPATISGATVTITGVGTVVLQASQAASGNYTAGTANASFTVAAEAPTITFSVANQTYGVAPFTVAATSNSSGAITYSVVSGPATISGSTVTITGAGTVVLQAAQAVSGNYTAGTANASFTVAAEAPTITFSVSNKTYGVAPFTVSASSNSSGAFTYSVVSGPATISGSTVTITGVGTVVLQASQAAAGNYTAATQNATFAVAAEAPTITFSVANQTYGVAPFTVSASSNSSGSVTYSVVSGQATISGSTVTITGVGTVVLQASQAANGNYTAGTANASFTVAAEAPSITFSVPNQTYGTAPFTVASTSNSSGAFTYSVVSGPATISGSTVTITGVGTVVLQASQAAAGNYTAGTQTASFAAAVEAQTITFTAPVSPVTYGISPIALSATASSGLAVTFSVVSGPATVSGSTLTITGPGAVVVAANQAGNAEYAAAPQVTQSIVVNPAVTITVAPSTATLSAGQTQQFTVTVSNASNTAVTWTISPTGLGSITASGMYTAPTNTSTQQTVTVTATSQADTTQSASGTVTLTPTSCSSSGYTYARAITIDHTQVPNTDQTSFPFLFNTTDPTLASTAYSGHVSNPNGYDIIFTSDAAGQNPLNYEMEEYNPVTGQVIAWIQIPTLSHLADTVIYMFYGNSSITAPQQNPTAVWDANYLGVWHVANTGGQLSLADSTSNQNNAIDNGAAATAGQIDGGMATNGTTYATVGTLPNLENTLSGTATYSVWVNPGVNTTGGIFGEDWPGWSVGIDNGDFAEIQLGGQGVGMGTPITPGAWSYLTVTITQITQAGGTQVSYGTLYLNGVLAQGYAGNSVTNVRENLAENPTAATYLGLGPSGFGNSQSAAASEDEFRISNIARSPDWIATEYSNQNSPATFFSLSPEEVEMSPVSALLYSSQSQQFMAPALNSCAGSLSWSITPTGVGTLTSGGLYTAPANISTQQTLTVTATNRSNPPQSVSATVTLMPPVAVSVSPATASITNGGQQQQFGSTVFNTNNTAVTWTTFPAGVGTINAAGLYTAPSTISAQQTVTVMATSQPDPAQSASATITLLPLALPPPPCASNGYSYVRPIVIDHSKIPNTDQANFPFLFNTTDPSFATTANGGHVANFNGDDILFSSDPSGQTQLNYELEEYNPVTGQVIAWVRIPNLSHTTDTVLYMFYGNPSIAAPQQNPAAVWDTNFMGVWHVPNGASLSLTDSTSNADNATDNGATATAGPFDGGMLTNGQTYATIGSQANLANLGHGNATFSAWVNNTGTGGIVLGKGEPWDEGWTLGLNESNTPELILYDADSGEIPAGAPLASGWNYVVATTAQNAATPPQTQVSLYVNGVLSGTGTTTFSNPVDDTAFPAYLAWNENGNFDYQVFGSIVGALDEFRISNTARSPDWITAEYYNQASPSTFYALYPENAEGALPSTETLYASQSEQFAATALCAIPAVTWSMPPGAPGMLTADGLYTAPSGITAEQSVVVTAISQVDGSTVGSATVTLMPPLSVSVNPSAQTLYGPNETLQFTASVTNATNTAVIWTTSPVGVGAVSVSGLYTAPPWFNAPQTVTITATSEADPTKSALATVTLMPVTITPNGYIQIYGGFSQQFAANLPVSWSVSPTGAGTISASGLFTAGANISNYQSVIITATNLADPNGSASAYVLVSPAASLSPLTATLSGGQTTQFYPCMAASATSLYCDPSVASWSVSPAGAGSVSSSGLYTAPLAISSTQTVVVTATDLANPLISVSATITLTPPVVSVTPANPTLYGEQTEQFFAQVANSTNSNVTWSISPAGIGDLSSSGLYSAPIGIPSQQTVTITATSQAVPTVSSSTVVTLSPTQCAAKAYGFVRSIAIDHTKVRDSDQANYPFLFSATDPAFASVANGGHIASPTGNDIFFSSDVAGVNRLDYELQEYNPTTGQILAWIRIPILTHASDTVIYMYYGSASVTASQQNPAGVWENGYQSVYHLANSGSGIATDSTFYGNNISTIGVTSTPGDFDTATGFDGSTSYMELPSADFASYPTSGQNTTAFAASFGVWFKTSSEGVILGQAGGTTLPGGYPAGWIPALYVDNSGSLRGSIFNVFYGTEGDYSGAAQLAAQAAYNDNQWHFAALTYSDNGTETLFVDGQTIGAGQSTVQVGYSSPYSYSVGTGYDHGWPNVSSNSGWDYFNGALEEVEVSSVARSGDWLLTEYLNQSSPATFSGLSPEVSGGASLNRMSISLYAAQSQQFTILEQGLCGPGGAVWSMPASSPGILSPSGLYTAPSSVDTQQTVNVTATTLGDQSTSLTATVTLMPPTTIGVTPSNAFLAGGQAQQLTAVVSNASNTAVTWSISPAGIGTVNSSGLYTAPAIPAVQTITVTATSDADSTQSASATITLAVPAPATISLTPLSAVLNGGQTQQLTASVSNATNTAVTWAIDPAGVGTISSSGLYTAPASVAALQTVEITATSNADPTLFASMMIDLNPGICAAGGYSYERPITIDHTKVAGEDQANFPVLINSADPSFATVAQGGHVNSPAGNDILFTSDSQGQIPLGFEIEEYNATNGQIVAWVKIPALSHTVDTIIYMFYGNPNVTASPQNPAGVWDQNFQGVYHLAANGGSVSSTDSTINGNSLAVNSVNAGSGQIDGAGVFDGQSSYLQLPSSEFASYPSTASPTTQWTASFGVWFQTTGQAALLSRGAGTPVNSGYPPAWSPFLYIDNDGYLDAMPFTYDAGSKVRSALPYADGNWHFATVTLNNGVESLYVDGSLSVVAQGVTEYSPYSGYQYFLGAGDTSRWPGFAGCCSGYLAGSLDEVRISTVARSAGWISTEYNNQGSPSSFVALGSENALRLSPATVSLYGGQSQQFATTGVCGQSSALWSVSSGDPGTISSSGLYTAPLNVSSLQVVTVTAVNQSNSSLSTQATVLLLPTVSISVSPQSTTLTANQTQQIVASVANSTNPAVSWSISPSGFGTLDSNGAYTAPASVASQQQVTITATSQEDSTKSASASITLLPSQCASNGYGYQRVIIVNHNKIANSDQINFPLVFSTTDPDLASVDYGGHVASPSGYDIIFSTDPNGQTKLDHEIEEYNPATGQIIAWIRIPTLSHSIDTLVYVFYGNPNITSPQQNTAGVWNSNYQAVYHLASLENYTTADSTTFGNAATLTAVSAAAGEIDGAAGFNGSSSYMQIPSADFPSYPSGAYNNLGLPDISPSTSFAASFGAWFKTASAGGILVQTPSIWTGDCAFFICFTGPTVPGDYDPASWNSMLYVDDNGYVVGAGVSTSKTYTDNQWHFAVVTYATDGTNTLYVDGQSAGSTPGIFPPGYSDAYSYFVGTSYTLLADDGNWNWLYLNGTVDEVTVSNAPFSADWIQTEYNNQSSPSNFYQFTTVSNAQLLPASIELYANQNQQFAVPGACIGSVVWSTSPGAPGSLSATGLYTAPGAVGSQQTVTITATSQATGTAMGNAFVTLLAPPQAITLAANGQQPYQTGTPQTFTATILDQQGNPQIGVTVGFAVSGPNSAFGNSTTNNSGLATFSYTGANSGSDTVVASTSISGQLLTSNSVTAAWVQPVARTPVAGVTLMPSPTLGVIGLAGAFTDENGAVIEPIAIGASAREFVVPAGATQLQLGVNSEFYIDDGGSGFNVTVNGTPVPVPPTAMPWIWTAGGLNTNYQYGIYNPSIQNGALDGTPPVVAARNLTAGQIVSVAYQSGFASANLPERPLVNANGDLTWTPGVGIWQGTYFPTLYMTTSAYPVGQPITFTAQVVDATGASAPNVPVTLNITGANPQQLQATTDSTGTAVFLYTGTNTGTDTLEALANPAGSPVYTSTSSTVTWVSPTASSPAGSLALSLFGYVNDIQAYVVVATDANGNPVTNANLGFYVWGVDNFSSSGATDVTGHAAFTYNHTDSGTYNLVAVESVDGNVIFSNPINGVWTMATSTNTCNFCNQISVSINALSSVTLPNTLTLTGTVTDNVGITPTVQWSQVSGPGVVTFAAPQQAVTTATFSVPGVYVVQLFATDTGVSATATFQVTVNPAPLTGTPQGWFASPIYGSPVTGIVPITLLAGETLQSGTLIYAPTNNLANVTPLPVTALSGQISQLDTTILPNGSYWIQLTGTDTSGNTQQNLLLVTVSSNYKPGRVTATVTDLVVPATGLAINIQRTYDSLNASTIGDFGYGWNLGINVNLTVGPDGSVTFTLGGQRRTFYLTPQPNGFLPYDDVAFTPEPGFNGKLTDSAPGCANYFDFVVPAGSLWLCIDGGQYSPPGYIYTDPNGTSYTISTAGGLQSIQDRSGNGLSITPNGITSTTGLNVPFVRDAQNRITQITDPQGNIYTYGYDSNGNLASVTYPNTSQPSTYTYAANHYYLSGTDFRANPLPVTAYYGPTDTDPNGLPLNGRLQSVTDSLGETTSYAYNLATHATTVTYPADASGNVGTATMVYDSYGMLLSSTDPLGHVTTNVYDANHNLVSVTDPLQHTTTYTYDQNGNKASSTYPATGASTNTTSVTQYNQYSEPTQTTDELGNVRVFNYDASYNPQSVTDSIGTLASFLFNPNQTLAAGAIGFDIAASPANASQFNYDANGNMIGRTDALGRNTGYVYNALGQKTSMTAPTPTSLTGSAASTTNYTYDQLGNLTQTAAPLARTTSSTYDGNGNKVSDTDARGNVTGYKYDSLNRLTETDYPDTTKATKTYDFRNNVVTETDQNGNVTQHLYDVAGRQIAVTRGFGTASASATSYGYDNAGRKTSEADALQHTTSYNYDAAGNLTAIAGVKGNFVYSYDNARNRISQTDARGNTTQFQYDARKRLTVTSYPDSTTKTNAYDGPGNLISVTDQAGNVVKYAYDAANELQSVVQTASPNPQNTTIVGYDSQGNPITLEDANQHITASNFDLLGELTAKTLPDGSLTENRQYDTNGNLVSLMHFNGVTTTYSYDALNRLLSRLTPGETPVSFTYTPTGKRQTMTDQSGTTSYSYDSMDRLTAKATPEGTLSYAYDAAGNLASIGSNHAHGVSTTYTYDSLNRLSTAEDGNLAPGANTTTYAYDPASNVGQVLYPNGVQSTMTYDALNRIAALATQASSYNYQRGAVGNLTNAAESTGRTVQWSYDGINRLTGETIAGAAGNANGSASYSLDPVGNRLSDTSSIPDVPSDSYGYNADDEVNTETYDQNGNTLATGGKAFSYDSENHLTSMNGGAVTLTYDGDGNRVAKTVAGVTTSYLVDDLNPTGYAQVVEELAGGVVSRQYTYGLQRINENQVIDNVWMASFYGYDGGGNVRILTSSAGSVTDTYEYDAFGNALITTGSTPNNYLYRGEQYDPDLGLYYLRARYYNPITGRFMSRDPNDPQLRDAKGIPIDPKKLHKYLYAGGDPVNAKDPTGKSLVGDLILMGETAAGVLAMELTDISLDFQTIAACVEDLLMWGADEDSAWEKCIPPL